jgi:peptide/nickel transport system permease protein
VLTIPINLRLARATTLSVGQREFVVAARTLGTTRRRILVRELAPLVARPLLAYLFVLVPLLVVADASLAFLELGTPQPEPTWGNMIAEGQDGVFEDHPHIVLVPSAAMFLTVFSLDVVAERLRARFDRGGRAAA